MGNGGITLKLSLGEVNDILESLADKPYREVFALIAKIKEEAEPQIDQIENK